MADQKMLTDWEDGHGDNVNCDEQQQKMVSQGMMIATWRRRWQYGERMMMRGLTEKNDDDDDD